MTVSNIFEVISKGEPGNITNDTGLDDVIVTEHMIQENIEKVDAEKNLRLKMSFSHSIECLGD